jgi:hypothetical protein
MRVNWTAVAILFAAIILVIGAHFVNQSIWFALTAVGTISAVIWAVYHQGILAWINRPMLEIVGPYEPIPPHIRRVPLRHTRKVLIEKETVEVETLGSMSYQLSIQIKNKGKTIARSASVLVSGMGWIEDGKWKRRDDWIAAPIRWALDVPADIGGEIPTEEKDLVPERPYVSNLAALRTDKPESFLLNTIVMPGNQRSDYGPGEYCFKVELFAEGADRAEKYFHIKWTGDCTWDYQEVKKKLVVNLLDSPIW